MPSITKLEDPSRTSYAKHPFKLAEEGVISPKKTADLWNRLVRNNGKEFATKLEIYGLVGELTRKAIHIAETAKQTTTPANTQKISGPGK